MSSPRLPVDIRSGFLVASLLSVAGCRGVPATVEAVADPPPPEPAPAQPESIFRDLFVTRDYGCVVTTDGKTWCWGTDASWKTGLRSQVDSFFVAGQVGNVAPAVAIDGTELATCAALENGTVYCWHWPSVDGSRLPSNPLKTVTGVVDVHVGTAEVCAQTQSGEVHCARHDGTGRRRVASRAVDVALRSGTACALTEDGDLWCWGAFASWVLKARDSDDPWAGALEIGPDGELLVARLPGAVELGTTEDGDLFARFEDGSLRSEPPIERGQDLPVLEWERVQGIDGAEAFARRGAHGCIIAGGEIRCHGANGWAQLGAGDTATHEHLVTVPNIEGARLVATSESLSCATTRDSVWCWGTHETPMPKPPPSEQLELVLARDVESVVVGYTFTCASRSDGSSTCWGAAEPSKFGHDDSGLHAAARPNSLKLGLGRLHLTEGNCFLDALGELICGEFEGSTFDTTFELFQRRSGVRDYAIPASPCWLRDGGLQCWTPDGQTPRPVPELRAPTNIAGRNNDLCVIHDGGKIGCFALAPWEPGRAVVTPERPELVGIPTGGGAALQLLNFDLGHCYASVDDVGAVSTWCFGGDLSPNFNPYGSPDFDAVTKLAATRDEFCGLTEDGRVQCAPYHGYDVRTLDLDEVVDITSAGNHWCALQRDGTLTCMGDTRWGQLGQLPTSLREEPTKVSLGPMRSPRATLARAAAEEEPGEIEEAAALEPDALEH